ncbi:MAG TPA: YncE family protein [Mycobacteriales bacterium]|nr:YncE family protein [Mycobacteriales bacterium]
MRRPWGAVVLAAGVLVLIVQSCTEAPRQAGLPVLAPPPASRAALPGMPPLLDPHDVYAATRPGHLSPATAGALPYVYVPHTVSNEVVVIDQRTFRVVRRFPAGVEVQHVVPAYDLKTLYATADGSNTLREIDPRTGRPGRTWRVEDPYNLYFTPDGRWAIDVAETKGRHAGGDALIFHDPRRWTVHHRLPTPRCTGIDHMDFTADGRWALASCEFSGRMLVLDVARQRVREMVDLPGGRDGMPQDVKLSPDGRYFYVADMMADGVYQLDAATMRVLRLIHTGRGAHGVYVDRTSTRMFVTNRGEGSITVLDPATGRIRTTWRLPGGGSPDMGGLNAAGTVLWLSGRYDGVVYALRTTDGRLLAKIRVGSGPHGLCVWPQPGRYSLGHTGVLR